MRERFPHLPEVDLTGAVVLPDFFDAHAHPLTLGLRTSEVSLDGTATKQRRHTT